MFGVIHTDGSGENNPPMESLSALYDELFSSGIVDGDVSVIDDNTHWCLSAYRGGGLVFGKLGDPSSDRHMSSTPKERVLELWKRLIDGDIGGLLKEPWKPGYCSRPDEQREGGDGLQ